MAPAPPHPQPDALAGRVIEHPGWVRPLGHVDGMVASGRHIFLAGQLGWDAQACFASPTLVGQVRQALHNIVLLLAQAGAGPQHITRMTWYLTDQQAWRSQLGEIAQAYTELIGHAFPPMTTVAVAGLLHDEAQVAIDVIAVVDTH